MKDDTSGFNNGYNEFAKEHGGPLQNQYQLYRVDVEPCRWFLAVNGNEPQLISPGELGTQIRFRNWHFAHGLKPPLSTQRRDFEEMIGKLYDTAITRNELLPFLQTDAGYIENLTTFFDARIPQMVRAKGQEFLDGKVGDSVRVKIDEQRVYFKWKLMAIFMKRVFYMKEKDEEMLKIFIGKKGGYQGGTGVGGWFRNTYWMPLDLFEESIKGWFKPDEE
jgi:hypothetical protein